MLSGAPRHDCALHQYVNAASKTRLRIARPLCPQRRFGSGVVGGTIPSASPFVGAGDEDLLHRALTRPAGRFGGAT
jgi:hypothetical protein